MTATTPPPTPGAPPAAAIPSSVTSQNTWGHVGDAQHETDVSTRPPAQLVATGLPVGDGPVPGVDLSGTGVARHTRLRRATPTLVASTLLIALGAAAFTFGRDNDPGAEVAVPAFGLAAAGVATLQAAILAALGAGIAGGFFGLVARGPIRRMLDLVATWGRAAGVVPAGLCGLLAAGTLPLSPQRVGLVLAAALTPAVAARVGGFRTDLRHRSHVVTARALGASPLAVARRHLLGPLTGVGIAAAADAAATAVGVIAALDLVARGSDPAGWGGLLLTGPPGMRVAAGCALLIGVGALRTLARGGADA